MSYAVYAYVWVSADSQAVNIHYDHVVQSEPNDDCRRFIKAGDLEARHHFKDVQDHAQGCGYCLRHDSLCILPNDRPHVLVVGTPCPIFSTMNPKAFEGNDDEIAERQTASKDYQTIEACAKVIRKYEPSVFVWENVAAVSKKRKRGDKDGKSPLDRVLELLRTDAYTGQVIMHGCSSNWQMWPRQRCYVVLVHQDVGGQVTATKIERMIGYFEKATSIIKDELWKDIIITDDDELIARRMREREAKPMGYTLGDPQPTSAQVHKCRSSVNRISLGSLRGRRIRSSRAKRFIPFRDLGFRDLWGWMDGGHTSECH